jgi:hypothetical protein
MDSVHCGTPSSFRATPAEVPLPMIVPTGADTGTVVDPSLS